MATITPWLILILQVVVSNDAKAEEKKAEASYDYYGGGSCKQCTAVTCQIVSGQTKRCKQLHKMQHIRLTGTQQITQCTTPAPA